MKHITYLVLLCICTMSCKAQTNNYAVISGTTHVKGIDSIYLTSGATNFKKAIAVNNGSFNDTITIDKTRSYNLMVGKRGYNVYLQNGYNLNISTTDSTALFSGVGADVNNYYKAKSELFMKQAMKQARKLNEARKLNDSDKLLEQELTILINQFQDESSTLLNQFEITDKTFKAFEKENIFWDEISNYMFYYNNRQLKAYKDATKAYTPSPGFLPQDFLSFKSDNEDLYINSQAYFNISSYIMAPVISFKEFKLENVDENIKFIDSLYNTLHLEHNKDYFLKRYCKRFIKSKDLKAAKTYLDYITSRLSDENTKEQYINFYYKNVRLKKGNLSPKFVDYENFAGGTTSLDDLKGKYVYIDVWSTWCSPCKKEIPFLQDVEKKYHNKNIAFVSISVDGKSNYDAWKKMVTDKQLGGIQLLADKADFESQFVKDYNITGIPRFILIDPEGKIIDSNAPRPSNPELIALFDGLLGI